MQKGVSAFCILPFALAAAAAAHELPMRIPIEKCNAPQAPLLYNSRSMTSGASNPLCLECGLCCNGVIFADVRLEPGDDASRLRLLGLPLVSQSRGASSAACNPNQKSKIKNPKFLQPCAAFDGCRCRIYVDRPKYCREFECLVLKNVQAGELGRNAALRLIRTARGRAEAARRLLRELGDTDEQVALSLRFRAIKQRMESDIPDAVTAGVFGRLTLAVHDLNVLLSGSFYSGTGGDALNSRRGLEP